MKKIVIIGGVAGGASAAARLRRLDEEVSIVLIERSGYISYSNCGLPYHVGGEISDRNDLFITSPETMSARFRIDVRVKSEAVAIDRPARKVRVRDLSSKKEYDLDYDKLILSPGAEAFIPEIEGVHGSGVFSLRTVEDMDSILGFIRSKKPKKAVVVGGGFVGLEMAENLSHAGLSVTIIEMADQVLPSLDPDMASYLQNHLKKNGVRLELSSRLMTLKTSNHGILVVTGNGKETLTDFVVLSLGVRPETKLAKEAGLEIGQSGGIKTDHRMRTSDPDIYAVGDAVEVNHLVTGKPVLIPLAGPANKQGRIAADNICGHEQEYLGSQGTSIIRVFGMTAAATGANEYALKKAGILFLSSITHPGSHAGYYPGSNQMTIKLLFSPVEGRILGAQIVGFDGVDKRIDTLAVAVRHSFTVDDLAEYELAYAPQFSSAKDPVNMAGFVGQDILSGLVKAIQWNEPDFSKDFILDVRTPSEYKRGHLPEAVNIEVDSLRSKLSEIPQGRRIVVYCQVGIRAWAASRILAQSGFENVVNLSGSYRHYEMNAVFLDKQKT